MDSASSNPVTELLARWGAGDAAAREALIPVVYNELRRLASRCLAGQHHQTLQSTALVHEAYLRLVGQASLRAESRSHFLAIAARLMREILVDQDAREGCGEARRQLRYPRVRRSGGSAQEAGSGLGRTGRCLKGTH